MSMFPWQGDASKGGGAPQPAASVSGRSGSSSSSFSMPQLRWLPSAMRTQNQTANHTHTLSNNHGKHSGRHQQQPQQTPPLQSHSQPYHNPYPSANINSHSQLQQPLAQSQSQHQQQQEQHSPLRRQSSSYASQSHQSAEAQCVAIAIDARTHDSSEDASDDDGEQSDSRSMIIRDTNVDDTPLDSDYVPMTVETTGGSSHAHHRPIQQSSSPAAMSAGGAATDARAGGTADEAQDAELDVEDSTGHGGSRGPGKRLTTKEEVSLFEICNRHAHTFGHRSNLCKWWQTVAEEFTRAQGHPYSWHSVRRKVEIVSKQRIKFLEDQHDTGGEDFSNSQWRETVDAWVPNWQRWEEAEAERIKNRDSRSSKKRKRTSQAGQGLWKLSTTPNGGWRDPSPATVASAAAAAATTQQQQQQQQHQQHQQQQPTTPSSRNSHPGLAVAQQMSGGPRLPPGYGTMFHTPTAYNSSSYGYTGAAGQNLPDSGVMAAILETLTKLNKHLDMQPGKTTGGAQAPDTASTATGTSAMKDFRSGQHDLEKMREELRQELQLELRRELEKDRNALEDKLDSVQRTQEMILEMLRQ